MEDDEAIDSLLLTHNRITFMINNETENYLGPQILGWHWIRISDTETEGIWKDPEDKENLTFTNWEEGSPRIPGRNESSHWYNHAVMNYFGKWYDTIGTADFSDTEVLCELS